MPDVQSEDLSTCVVSPMPGKVVSINVKEGQDVVIGQPLMVLEAMKMQNVIRAEKAARVRSITVMENDTVAVEEKLLDWYQ
jgi:propionyl-CoA carboxylase alpha chain